MTSISSLLDPLTSSWPHLRCDTLVWKKGNIEQKTLSVFTVLYTIIMVHIGMSSSYRSESASRCSSVSMGWHRTTCLLCATLHPDSLDARIFALRIADSSTFHTLHCRRAVFKPSRMLVHLCGTLCPFISRTAI